jgi:hypothetical protein
VRNPTQTGRLLRCTILARCGNRFDYHNGIQGSKACHVVVFAPTSAIEDRGVARTQYEVPMRVPGVGEAGRTATSLATFNGLNSNNNHRGDWKHSQGDKLIHDYIRLLNGHRSYVCLLVSEQVTSYRELNL